MSNELKQGFDKLSIDDKRNEISKELMIITEIIKDSQEFLGVNSDIIQAKNYNPSVDFDMNESDILTYFYEDIFSIRNEISLLNVLLRNNDDKRY